MQQAELPNVLDLLCVSVEAGLGFDAAVSKLSERMEGPLVDEFGLVLHEMRIGESRSAALKNLSDRVDVPEVAAVLPRHHPGRPARYRPLADPAGAVARHAHRRQLAAEEKAMKAPVKMLFPTVRLHLPLDVRGRPRAGRAQPDADVRRRQVADRVGAGPERAGW